ncbi:MAG: DUF885 domain-containing protein [Thermoanaerobaculia bacterium]|nr:DUF885 domain-containing protein [Thermoanaerobaculia bacterium]
MRRAAACLVALPIAVAAWAGATAGPGPSERLHDLFDREWEWRLAENPLLASGVGRHEWDDRLPSVAAEDQRRRAEATRVFLAELDALAAAELSPSDRVNAAIFRRQLESRLADFRFGAYQIPLNADSGWHSGFARLPAETRLESVADYDGYLARLEAFPVYASQQIDNMRAGLERGMTLPRVALEGVDHTIRAHVVDDPRASVFWRPFERFPAAVPESDRDRLSAAGERAIREVVVPAYRAFLDFMLEEYLPGARETLGASELPDGEAYYAHRIRYFTTLDLTAEEIHRIGLEEVARIRGEMEGIVREVGFEGDFAAFLEFLRTDPRFYAKTPEELLMQASTIAKRMDGKLPSLFRTLPRQPYGVEPVPDEIAPKYTGGRYVGAPLDSRKAGTYWVNTYKLDSRPLYTLEALSLHEAVPGHHLQIALSRELDDLPEFRRHSYISAFGEGWGLYAEWLGLEAGFYTDPYSDFGRLTYEMWRACRLVVDTGLHQFGWSRQRAMDFLAGNTALSLHEVTTETDRYISWPGQALAYKIGELEIRRLRREAEERLGPRFDVREFHDAVLLQGSVPLPVLAEQVARYVETTAAGAAE